ncbi:MAG: hypothetical protein AAF462_01300 [Thermodesulfobacteriota bacterium]
MISDELNELIRPVVLVQKLIWFIIVGSIIFYIGFVYFFTGENKAISSPDISYLQPLIYILASLSVLGSIFYYRYALSESKLNQFMTKDVDIQSLVMNPRTKEIDSDKLAKLKSLSDRDTKIYSLMFELQKITIIVLILNEVTAILGSVLAFVNDDAAKIVPFAIASLVLSFWMFPRHMPLIKKADSLN